MAHLNVLGKLARLNLGNTDISDASLGSIRELTNLFSTWIYGTPVTDTGLAQLKRFPSRSELHLEATQVTDTGLKDLKQVSSEPQDLPLISGR